MRKTKAEYEALYCDLKKHSALLDEDYDLIRLSLVENKIFTCELIEDYGWAIPSCVVASREWFKLSENLTAGTFGGATNRSISWEDNGKDPDGEFLLKVFFPTGAYIFGEDYDTDFFKRFFMELQEYEPKFKDSANNSLYFSKDKAGIFLGDYDGIFKKYRDMYRAESNKRKAEKLREELKKLEE